MEINDLIKLGFNRNEAIVYFSLIKFQIADANMIIKDTKFHKNIIYDNLEKLIDKGLVTFRIEDGKKIFSLSSPDALTEYLNEQEKELLKKKELAKEIVEKIKNLAKHIPEKQEATVYRGIKAVKTFYNEALKGGPYYVIGSPQSSIDIMGEGYWKEHDNERVKIKLFAYMIFNSSIRKHGELLKNKYTKIKYFEKDFEPNTETHIQDDYITIIVWSKDPLMFKIKNKSIADSYKKYFDKLWKQTKY
jgi:HTH-type transcriptional regulator, sugar sensing transcriptional regulator